MDDGIKSVVETSQAPQAVGAYSQAVVANGFVFLSGQVPIDPATGQLVPTDDAREQAKQVMGNLAAVLKAAHVDFHHVVKATIFLADIADFKAVNEVYAAYFKTGVKPARAAFQVGALPLGARVAIDMIAVAAGGGSRPE